MRKENRDCPEQADDCPEQADDCPEMLPLGRQPQKQRKYISKKN